MPCYVISLMRNNKTNNNNNINYNNILNNRIKKDTNNLELKLLSREQVAELLSVSKMTIKRYEKRGMLHPVILSSRSIRYHSQDVQKLVQQAEAA
jgi:predicted DNA-binding transcriptional regulator AlpA